MQIPLALNVSGEKRIQIFKLRQYYSWSNWSQIFYIYKLCLGDLCGFSPRRTFHWIPDNSSYIFLTLLNRNCLFRTKLFELFWKCCQSVFWNLNFNEFPMYYQFQKSCFLKTNYHWTTLILKQKLNSIFFETSYVIIVFFTIL